MSEQWNNIRKRFQELEQELSKPDLFANPQQAKSVTREHARLREILETHETLQDVRSQLADNEAMLHSDDSAADDEFREMVEEELARLTTREAELVKELQLQLVPPDPNDDRNIIIEIRAGTGGEEAALFAGDLLRMYTRYAEQRHWKLEHLDMSPAERGGVKEVVFSLQGDQVYRYMRHESGVHRVQRVPVTESSGRIHTSAATVAVLPEAEEVEIDLPAEDIRVDVYRSSGPGGQSVNTTDSAVRITHLPTGVVVTCQDEKSQHKNKAKALRILRARILEMLQQQEHEKQSAERRTQVGSGDRSERIRTYNFPQNRVTDHRIHLTLHSLDRVMEGEIDPILDALVEHTLQERLKESGAAAAIKPQ
jgi:peptide chain release factor 1